MAKAKTPVFSLSAHGSLAEALTFQRSRKANVTRSKPTPKQPNSLSQQYQRWLYQDYIRRWHALTPAQQLNWKSLAARYHMTGFAYFMRDSLNNLSNLALGYQLDNASGSSTPDFSRNSNDGTVFGATIVDGIIGKAFHFDGVDDYINAGNDISLQISGDITICLWLRPLILGSVKGVEQVPARKIDFVTNSGWRFVLWPNDKLYFTVGNGVGFQEPSISFATWINSWKALAGRVSGNDIDLFVTDTIVDSKVLAGGLLDAATKVLEVGKALPANVDIDHLQIWDIALPDDHVIDILSRRYP